MSKFSVRKPLTIFVAVLAVIILGVVAFTRMTPDLFPNMDFPYVLIMTTYPGQSPETVEAEITRPLEQSMATLEHIKEVTSSSNENYSIVVLEFEDDVNMDTIGVDIQQGISVLQGVWDESVGTPYVLKINPSVIPIAIAAVSRDNMDITELSDFLDETIIPKLEGVTGVASVSAVGSIYRQVHVVISQDKIDEVNRRMADAVNTKLDDARVELEESRAELEESRAELEETKADLEDAQSQLDSGKEALIGQTATAQSTLNEKQTELLEGKIQLQQQLVSLQTTKATLVDALAQLQEAADGIAQLEDGIAQLEKALAQLDALPGLLERARGEKAALEEQISQLQWQIDSLEDQLETMDPEDEGRAELEDQLMQLRLSLTEAQTGLAVLEGQIVELEAQVAAGEAQRAALETQLAGARAALDAMDAQLAAQGISRAELGDKIKEVQASLDQVNDGIAQMESTLAQLDSGAIQLNEALATLNQSQSAGLLELADAAAQLAIGSATVESGLAQVESGLEQLDEGLETLEESRADALDAADLSGTLTLSTVTAILNAQNFSMPAGYVEENGVSYMVSVGDEMTDEAELAGLVLFDTGEDAIGPVYLADVADVFITDNADESYAKLNGSDSVMLTFDKQSNAATAEVSDNLNARFRQLEAQYPGLEFVFLMDQGDYIYLIVNSIMESLLTGALFAILILLLFLRDLRPTVITLVSIPVSVIFAFVLMYFSGVTLNMISLSGLAVAVGMLVDNSIVVIENIYRLRAKGATAVQAAVVGAKQVAGAITSSTLTTVCVFLPIVFVQGLTRQLFTDLALTMSYSLLASLVVALTLVPAMAKGMLKDRRRKREKSSGEGKESVFYRAYRVLAGWSLGHKWVVLPLAVLLLVGSAWAALNKGFSYMPEMDMNMVSVTITMPEGTSREEAMAMADEALARIGTLDNLEYVGAMMGGGSVASTDESYNVSVYVGLPEGASGAAAGKKIAALCADLDCEIDYDSQMMDMSYLSGSGIAVNVYGEDMEDLQSAAETIAQALATVDGVADVNNGLEDAETAYHVSIDRNAAMEKGWTVAQMFVEIAGALTDSTTAMDMAMGSVTADVIVQTEAGMSLRELEDYTFDYTDSEGDTQTFALKDVATIEPTVSLSTIRRVDQRRYLTVSASIAEGYNVTRVTSVAEQAVAAVTMPGETTYEFDGENETIMAAVEDLALMLLLGLVLVYFVMVAQFQSLKSPFIVMFTIPLAFTGGFVALLLFGMDVSIVSLIGFVMLMGIIVNNGIVLVDYVNQLRADGMARRNALIEAGVTRMRPIFMTSLTTILGLIVMALGNNVGTSMMQPVAVVCIGGLLYATIMTLFVVPCIYDMMNKKDIIVITDEDMEFDEASYI